MKQTIFLITFIIVAFCSFTNTNSQEKKNSNYDSLIITSPTTKLRLIPLNTTAPIVKILLPLQPDTIRGIEIEVPEHIGGNAIKANQFKSLFKGPLLKQKKHIWIRQDNMLYYEMEIKDNILVKTIVTLNDSSVTVKYILTNKSQINYSSISPVTCVSQYDDFEDNRLERTYGLYQDGFELLASETPERLTLPLNKWFPCRYRNSYSWQTFPNGQHKTLKPNGITTYDKSKKITKPFLATISHNKQWIVATYSPNIGNIWTNPERTCQHADPHTNLGGGETKTVAVISYIFKGSLEDIIPMIDKEELIYDSIMY